MATLQDGVSTSCYTAVQFVCTPRVIDDPDEKAAVLTIQLADLQPEGRHTDIHATDGP